MPPRNDRINPEAPQMAGAPEPPPLGVPSEHGAPTEDEIISAQQRADELRAGRERAASLRQQIEIEEENMRGSLGRAHGDHTYSREDWDRAAEPTDPVRRSRIREIFDDASLPNLPRKAGFRRCWASTTHNIDTPQRRIRLGFWFYKLQDARTDNWEADQYAVLTAGSLYAGCLMWREMIAMETDEANYVAIMRELHHDAPHDQQRGILDNLEAAGNPIRERGGRTTMSPGFENLRQFIRPPRQFE